MIVFIGDEDEKQKLEESCCVDAAALAEVYDQSWDMPNSTITIKDSDFETTKCQVGTSVRSDIGMTKKRLINKPLTYVVKGGFEVGILSEDGGAGGPRPPRKTIRQDAQRRWWRRGA